MTGPLQSAIVEIRLMYDSFLSLTALSPNLPPDCVIECLEKVFGNDNRHGSMFTRGNSRDQIRMMKNLQASYEAYKTLAKTSPKSAPVALIRTLESILKPLNQVKVETTAETDELDPTIEIVDLENEQNVNDEFQDGEKDSDGSTAVLLEQVNPNFPSTSFSSLHTQLQQRVKNWVQGQPLPNPIKISISTPACSTKQDENNLTEVASQNTDITNTYDADTDNNLHVENADENVSNEDSSSDSSSDSLHSTQNEQQNQSEIPVVPAAVTVYECSYGCGKTFRTEYWQLVHEKIHTGAGLVNCDFCERQFATTANCMAHQYARHDKAAVKKLREKRVSSNLLSNLRCDLCQRKFPNIESLGRHRATYTADRLQKCRFPPCTKGFCYKSDLTQHEKRHAKMSL